MTRPAALIVKMNILGRLPLLLVVSHASPQHDAARAAYFEDLLKHIPAVESTAEAVERVGGSPAAGGDATRLSPCAGPISRGCGWATSTLKRRARMQEWMAATAFRIWPARAPQDHAGQLL